MKLTEKQNQELFELVKKYVESIKDEVETPKTKTVYDLVDGDEYSFYGHDGCIYTNTWCNNIIDLFRRKTGNCFLTEQQCQDGLDYINAKADYLEFIREWNGNGVIDWNNDRQWKKYLEYHYSKKIIRWSNCSEVTDKPNQWYYLEKPNRDFLAEVTEKLGKDKVILAITGIKL